MTNAKFYRNLICAGLGALALCHVPLSHAFYAQLTPPAGFTAGAINTYNAAKAGVTASVELGRIAANASLNVGGRAVSVATRLAYSGNAMRVAASLLYLHPAVRAGVKVATVLGLAGLAFDIADGAWKKLDSAATVSDGNEYSMVGANQWHPSKQGACSSYKISGAQMISATVSGSGCLFKFRYTGETFDREIQGNIETRRSSCPAGWYSVSAGCQQSPPMAPVTQEQFVEDLTRQPSFPNILPELPFDLPVEVPFIQPIFAPTGAPVKNPNYDASKPQTGENQPYVQPGVKVDPANDAKNPFQVNVQPTDRPTAGPQGSTDPQPINPPGTDGDGSTDKPKEDKDERDLCEKNPDILACQKVDTEVEDAEIPKAEKTVRYAPENPFGGGSCPADQYAKIGTQQMKVIDWTQDCMFIRDYVRPIAFAITALIVAGILAGALKP